MSSGSAQVRVAYIGGGALVVAALIAGFFTLVDRNPSPTRPITQTVTGGSTGVIQTGDGTIHITSIEGISEEKLQALSEELGVTKAALKSFFEILGQKQVPPEDLDSTLRKIAERYQTLDQKLATFTSDDPVIQALKNEAREALEQGDFDRAERLLNQASDKDVQAAKAMQVVAKERLLSAAASKAENGDLKTTQLAYTEAAEYYRQAAALVPASEAFSRALYLNQEGKSMREAGRYADAEDPLELALAIREKVLGPEHPDVATSLNNLASLYGDQGRYAEAEPLYQRSLAIMEKALGSDHSSTVTIRENYEALKGSPRGQ